MAARTRSGIQVFRTVLWVLVGVIAVGATALFLFAPPQQPAGVTGTPFSLQSTQGGVFTQASLAQGTPSLVFFGYTFCPDVCPVTLAESVAWRDALNLEPDELNIVFASVDPERDTLEELDSYLSGFQSPIIGLTGTPAEVEAAKRSFGVFSQKNGSGDDYLVDHTASVFMIDGTGAYKGTIGYGEAMGVALDKVRSLIGLDGA